MSKYVWDFKAGWRTCYELFKDEMVGIEQSGGFGIPLYGRTMQEQPVHNSIA